MCVSNVMWCFIIRGWSFAQKYSCLCSLVYGNALVKALRNEYLKRFCRLAFCFFNKMGLCDIFVLLCVCVAHLQCCGINDSRGEWTLAVKPLWLFWADPVWVDTKPQVYSKSLAIVSPVHQPQRCRNISTCWEKGGECSLHTRAHIESGKGHWLFSCMHSSSDWKLLSERPNKKGFLKV